MINRLQETNQPVAVQQTTFSVDVMGRFICNTGEQLRTRACAALSNLPISYNIVPSQKVLTRLTELPHDALRGSGTLARFA